MWPLHLGFLIAWWLGFMVRGPKVTPNDPYLLVFTTLCNLIPLSNLLLSNKIWYIDGIFHPWLSYKRLRIRFSLSCWLWWSKLLCWRGPHGKELRVILANSQWVIKDFNLIILKELNPANNHINDLGSGSFPTCTFRWDPSPGWNLDCSLGSYSRGASQVVVKFLTQRNRDIKCVLF